MYRKQLKITKYKQKYLSIKKKSFNNSEIEAHLFSFIF